MQKFSGFVPIIGAPNAGKSTLLNAILGQKISIVTAKPQTTRNRITGIYTNENVQIVFVDTPGVLDPKYKLQQFMSREIESSVVESDIIILVIDINKYDRESFSTLYNTYNRLYGDHKIFCVINKIDLVRKEQVLPVIKDISENFRIDEIIPVSAVKGFNIEELLKTIIKYLPEGDFYFESDVLTSQPEKFFVAEIIRQNILRQFKDEIPFSVHIDIEEFKERETGKDFIRASVIVERETQKAIIIGDSGNKIKKLGELSRKAIEEFLDRPVYLELFAKVRKDWKNDEDFLKKNFNKFGTSTA
ncbi:MAG: GTPase Era [Ignavibacteria bacterium]|nr:GTPase Era [Ignavibacteria bacterium]